MENLQKKKKRTSAHLVLNIILIILIIVTIVNLIRYKMHSYEPESYGSYEWNSSMTFDLNLFSGQNLYLDSDDTDFKVLQFSDTQLKFGSFTSDTKTIKLMDAAIKAEDPDLVVIAGDVTCSIFTYDAYKYLANHLEKLGVYWTLIFGNHDAQFDCSKYTLYNLLKNYKYCLFDCGPSNIKGAGNFLINVYQGQSATVPSYSLVMLDSNMYPEDSESTMDWVYDWIGEDQIAWYEWAIKGLQALNPNIKSTMYFHMPIREYADMYYANELQLGHEINSNIDTSNFKEASQVTGYICEDSKSELEVMDPGYTVGIYYQGEDTGIFDAVKALGSTTGIFCGHDHVNNLKGYYDGIYLAYGLSSGYHTYPFFEKSNFLLHWFGLDDKVLWNMENWTDDEGHQLQKGATVMNIDLGSNYGNFTVVDRDAKYYGVNQ